MNTVMFPLSIPQEAILSSETLNLQSNPFYIGAMVSIDAVFCFTKLIDAVQCINETVDVFKVGFIVGEGQIQSKAICHDESRAPIDAVDFSRYPDASKAMESWIYKQLKRRDPLSDYVIRIFAVKINDRQSGWFIKGHHAAVDGAGMINLIRYLLDALENRLDANACMAINYSVIAESESRYLQSQRFKRDQIYWQKVFSDSTLSAITARNPMGDYHSQTPYSRRFRVALTKNERQMLEQFRSGGGSLFRLFFAAVAVAQMALEDTDGVLLQAPILNRWNQAEKKAVSMAVSSILLPVLRKPNATVADYYRQLEQPLKRAIIHSRYAPGLRWQSTVSQQWKTLRPHFGVSLQTEHISEKTIGQRVTIEHAQIFEPLMATFHIHERFGNGDIEFEADFRQIWPEQRCQALLDYVVKHALQAVSVLSVANKVVHELKKVSTTTGIGEILQRSLNRHHHEILLKLSGCEAVDVNYSQAKQLISQIRLTIAQHWQNFELDGPVLLLGRRCKLVILAYYACLLDNVSVVPVCPTSQAQRIQSIAKDAGATVCLCVNQDLLLTQTLPLRSICLSDVIDEDLNSQCANRVDLSPAKKTNNPAYVLYTSGSTGKPKGVMVDADALAQYTLAAADSYRMTDAFNMPVFTSLGFDLTQTSLLLPPLTGGFCQLFEGDLSSCPELLTELLKDAALSAVKCTPAHLQLLLEQSISTMVPLTFIVGGEGLSCQLVKKTLDNFPVGTRVVNEYGPTEATVGCCIQIIDKNNVDMLQLDNLTPIGRALGSAQISIRDSFGVLVPNGFTGELCIAGPILARGYLNNLEQTERSFVFSSSDACQRWYRTGDVGFRDHHDIYHCRGRLDDELKIRGHRIHPAEIERATREVLLPVLTALDLPEIKVLKISRQQQEHLVLCFNRDVPLEFQAIRERLVSMIPNAWLPTYYCVVPNWPLTKNGKVNVAKLMLSVQDKLGQTTAILMPKESTKDYQLPDWMIQDCLQRLWLDGEYDLRSSFLQLGGDSIMAIRLVALLAQRSVLLNAGELLSNQSLGMVLEQAWLNTQQQLEQASEPKDIQVPETLNLHLLPSVQWYRNCQFNHGDCVQQGVVINLDNQLSAGWVHKAVEAVKRRHFIFSVRADATLSNFWVDENDEPGGTYHLGVDSSIRARVSQLKSAISLSKTPSVHEVVFDCANDNMYLVWICHHLLCDVFSWIFLLEELHHLLYEKNIDKISKEYGLVTWAHWLAQQQGHVAATFKANPDLPYGDKVFTCLRQKLSLMCYEIRALEALFKATRSQIIASAIIAVAIEQPLPDTTNVLFEHSGREFTSIDIPAQQRAILANSVGWFTGFTQLTVVPSDDMFLLIKRLKTAQRSCSVDVASYLGLDQINKVQPDISINDIGSGLKVDNDWPLFKAFHSETGGYRHSGEVATSNIDAVLQDSADDDAVFIELSLASDDSENRVVEAFLDKLNVKLTLMYQAAMASDSHYQCWLVSDFPFSQLSQAELENIIQ